MTTPEIIRTLYGTRPAPADARRRVERLVRSHGGMAVREAAKRTARELGGSPAHEDTPLLYVEAVCRQNQARAQRRAEA